MGTSRDTEENQRKMIKEEDKEKCQPNKARRYIAGIG